MRALLYLLGFTISTNRLINTASPYLLQHAHNPVDWFPWGDEAFTKARAEAKPIFLSIGYSACHWCHVMERESFEDPTVAAFLNDHFVSIKVDREERPDVDEIYMTAVQLTTGSGGWPLTLFLTPDLKPFYGGTYFPPEDRWGKPGFGRLIEMISDAYATRKDEVERIAGQLANGLSRAEGVTKPDDVSLAQIERAAKQVAMSHDPFLGGFGPAPKFPPTGQCDLLLHEWKRTGNREYLGMVERTLGRMAAGGINDQLAGGFARYSTDAEYLIPHFEKMLYDNALLTVNFLDLFLATGNQDWADVARRTLDWMLTDMLDPAGGFHSSLDADSEGEEGKFYVWLPGEIKFILGDEDGTTFCELFGVEEGGNFDHGRSVLHLVQPEREAELRPKVIEWKSRLLAARDLRIHPGKDDKVLTDWNALAISALSQAYRALGDQRYLEAAQNAARFLKETMWHDGRLLHSWRGGVSGASGLLDDHAYLIAALVELYQADFDPAHLIWAAELSDTLIEHFFDQTSGGFFISPAEAIDLIIRPKVLRDGATPSGNGVAAKALLELWLLSDREDFRDIAHQTIRAFSKGLNEHPSMFLRPAIAASLWLDLPATVAISGQLSHPLVRNLQSVINGDYHPGLLVACGAEGSIPLLRDRTPVDGLPAAYLCQNMVCKTPISDPGELRRNLTALHSSLVETETR